MPQLSIQQAFELALRHHRAGRLREAEQICRRILHRQPKHVPAAHLLGTCLHRSGKLDEAIACFEKVASLDRGNPLARAILGDLLREQGNLDGAILAYRNAIALKPDWPDVHNSLGDVLRTKGNFSAAIAACRQAILLRPAFAQAHNNLGNALREAGLLDEAVNAYQRACELDATLPEPFHNLGVALNDAGQLENAEASFRNAIALRPTYAEAHNNLGSCLRAQGKLNEAIVAIRGAIRLQPDFALAHYNLAMALLAGPDLPAGWDEHEWRWKCRDFPSKDRGFAQPLWDGSTLEGRTILLHAEQGFGDTIQFIRYLPAVAERGGKIIIECQPELLRLLQTSNNKYQFIPRGETLLAFDIHCPLLTLPRIFRTTLQSIPADVPYLFPDAALVENCKTTLGPKPAELKIGLAWAGNPHFSSDPSRSLSLDQLAPLAAVPGVTFFSFQKGYAAPQAARPPAGMRLVDLSADLHDFADTAAAITLMDLVITTDTSVAHLSGAMGIPVWTLLRFAPDWRWLRDRDDCPWYPSMRLFRQTARGDWDGVIHRVKRALAERG